MHGEKRDVEPGEEQPEMNLGQQFVGHAAHHLGKEVIDAAEHREHSASDEHVVEVRHNKEGIVDLNVDGNRRQHYSAEATDQESEEETRDPQHGQLQLR